MISSLRDFAFRFAACACLLLSPALLTPLPAALKQVEGRHLRLTTDLTSDDEIQQIVDSFDAAVPQWIRFWNLSEAESADFRVEACVMQDRGPFLEAGLIPSSVPDFPFGYAHEGKREILSGSEGLRSLPFYE